jgi:hypothetical protein
LVLEGASLGGNPTFGLGGVAFWKYWHFRIFGIFVFWILKLFKFVFFCI